VGFGISGVETFGSPTRELFTKMDLGEICCGEEMWIEPAQDRIQMWDLVSAVLKLLVLLPESCLLRWILEKYVVGVRGGLNWLRIVYRCGIWYQRC
jgi:hypothetical protein